MAEVVRRRTWLALAAALVLALTFTGVQITPGVASDTPDAGPRFNEGTITLRMQGSTSQFEFVPTGGTLEPTPQPIGPVRKNSCEYQSNSTVGEKYVKLAVGPGSPGTVGFSSNSLGVNSEPANSGKCAQVNVPNEVLVVKLANDGTASSPQRFDGMYWDWVELDIEAKFGATFRIEIYKDNQRVAEGHYDVQANCTTITGAADCGNDSTADNFRIRVPATGTLLMDELRIFLPQAANNQTGGVSLEGGGDTGTSPSTFHVVTPAEAALCPGDFIREATGAGNATVTYEGNEPNCENPKFALLTYTRNATTNARELFFRTEGGPPTARFDVVINAWDPETAQNPVPLSRTDPAGADNDPAGEWCNRTPAGFEMPADESWCAYSLQVHPVGTQQIQVTEGWLLDGDARLNR